MNHVVVVNAIYSLYSLIHVIICLFWQSVLTSASEQLHDVTGGRLRWERIRIVAPPGCNAAQQLRQQQQMTTQQQGESNSWTASTASTAADMVIGDSHPLLGDLPHAQQFAADCGRRRGGGSGGVRMSRQFILRQQPQQQQQQTAARPLFLAGNVQHSPLLSSRQCHVN